MTVAKAHALYMRAVHEGRSSRRKRTTKPLTIKDKILAYQRDIGPNLRKRNIYDVTEEDLIKIVEKRKNTKISANHLANELKAFFGWAASLTGKEVGLAADPASRLSDLRFPEKPRSRILDMREIEWLLLALSEQPRQIQRCFLLCLLTAARISEVTQAKSSE